LHIFNINIAGSSTYTYNIKNYNNFVDVCRRQNQILFFFNLFFFFYLA
jgi:hypothetical protein